MIYGEDEFARPHLLRRYPRYSEYLADSMSYYPDSEPESNFVAVHDGKVVGALLGAVDTERCDELSKRHVRPLLIRRCMTGAYGWPGWLAPIALTELAGRHTNFPEVDLEWYPAHLHLGVLREWRRQGIGTQLMAHYTDYLRRRGVPGFHLYASSFHPLGVAFYRKLQLEVLGHFEWRFHDGVSWRSVTERVFGQHWGHRRVGAVVQSDVVAVTDAGR